MPSLAWWFFALPSPVFVALAGASILSKRQHTPRLVISSLRVVLGVIRGLFLFWGLADTLKGNAAAFDKVYYPTEPEQPECEQIENARAVFFGVEFMCTGPT